MFTRYFAVDIEFLKCRGSHFARSIAFVPFEARKHDSTFSSNTERACTCFREAPTVLAIESNEVMRRADVLPCGHLLYPYLREHLASSEALEEIKKNFQRDSDLSLQAYRDMQRTFHEKKRFQVSNRRDHQAKASDVRATEMSVCAESNLHELPLNGIQGSTSCVAFSSSSSSTFSPSSSLYSNDSLNEQNEFDDLQFPIRSQGADNLTFSPTEIALRRRLQIRAAITHHFELFDPYTIPNIHLWEEDPFRRLYTDPTDSATFSKAVGSISRIRAYGRGKGKHKALAFLFHYYPEFAQAVLRASFRNATAWCDFLRACAELVWGQLRCVDASYRQQSYPFMVTSSAPLTAGSAPLFYKECATLEAFSATLNQTWSHFLSEANGNKFFTYGNVDAKVLSTTLQLSCDEYRQMYRQRTQFPSSECNISESGRTTAIPHLPKDVLLSPFQAKVLDITKSSLFSGSGFIRDGKRIPGLLESLQRVSSCDSTAEAVLSIQRPHDPLWDAQALACVCVGAGIVRSMEVSRINGKKKANK